MTLPYSSTICKADDMWNAYVNSPFESRSLPISTCLSGMAQAAARWERSCGRRQGRFRSCWRRNRVVNRFEPWPARVSLNCKKNEGKHSIVGRTPNIFSVKRLRKTSGNPGQSRRATDKEREVGEGGRAGEAPSRTPLSYQILEGARGARRFTRALLPTPLLPPSFMEEVDEAIKVSLGLG